LGTSGTRFVKSDKLRDLARNDAFADAPLYFGNAVQFVSKCSPRLYLAAKIKTPAVSRRGRYPSSHTDRQG